MKRLALIGSRAFASQIRQYAENTNNYRVVGCFDDFEEKGKLINGIPVFGGISDVEEVFNAGAFDCLFFAAGYNNFQFRENAFLRFKGKVPFATIIMPTAQVSAGVKIGEGVFIGDGCFIAANTQIEDNVFIHGSSHIGHDNHIDSHTYISGRFDTAGFCTIGKRCFIGIRVCISDHITICDDAWIGLACVVAKDIKEPGKYMSAATKLYKVE